MGCLSSTRGTLQGIESILAKELRTPLRVLTV
jgi:hypothetical protein